MLILVPLGLIPGSVIAAFLGVRWYPIAPLTWMSLLGVAIVISLMFHLGTVRYIELGDSSLLVALGRRTVAIPWTSISYLQTGLSMNEVFVYYREGEDPVKAAGGVALTRVQGAAIVEWTRQRSIPIRIREGWGPIPDPSSSSPA
jgi:hypothetical protein